MTPDPLPLHWAQVDPGPLTDHQRTKRLARLERERDRELAKLTAWRDSIVAELDRTASFYDALIAREKRRPTRKEPAA